MGWNITYMPSFPLQPTTEIDMWSTYIRRSTELIR